MTGMDARKPIHAGTWYTDSGQILAGQLNYWLNEAEYSHGPARAVIAPHAAYQYSGACAAYAYKQICADEVKRIFILGPSHHVGLSKPALPLVKTYQTPFYDLRIDSEIIQELQDTGKFQKMDIDVDQNEHSIEMQLPFVAKVMEKFQDAFSIIPILIGTLDPSREAEYGKILAPYLGDPQNLFVISSDFCHWGSRFDFTYYDSAIGKIYKSIEYLDKLGMDIIEHIDPCNFEKYLNQFKNTICGRCPIAILLHAVQDMLRRNDELKVSLKFVKYTQSKKCVHMTDSSVSYASASLRF